ncbi:hypothetical protein HOG16_01210 [Candidatus Woesearchaeota archaeon]|jgi:hypothetical protein|nr:hypothetical protein [Candidatus Woesearchaeota archaeon]MBT4321702.1 hypothetical protein [Candidatus Woesearchaeota archaeon]MBT4630714.1 hypothetical protein [Candidatus Woesearchaeota archaeon]
MVNKPINKYKSGAIEAAIWSNEKTFNENTVEFKTVSLTRSWKKKGEDIWRSESLNLRRQDLIKAILVLQKAQEELLMQQSEGEAEEDE